MKRLILTTIILFGLVCFAQAQTTVTLAWDYDTVEAQRIEKWILYQSTAPGGPYISVVEVQKTADQSTYEEMVSSDDLNGKTYLVLSAYGDANFSERESPYSNEIFIDFSGVSAPFNLRIIIE